MRVSLFLLPALLTAASPAFGCEKDSPTARLPGYSDQQAEDRAYKLWSDWDVIWHYNRTKALIDEASAIYLARVSRVESVKDGILDRFTTTVEPLSAIKGVKPVESQTLQGTTPSSCDAANGDGDGVYTGKEDLIIVFEGVAKRDDRPRGIDSVRVSETRNIELLDQVQAWLNSQPGYRPWD